MTTPDENLIKVLDAHQSAARQAFLHPHERIEPDPFEPVRVAMDAHPDFAKEESRFFLGRQLYFNNHSQASNLLRVAVKGGAPEALRWYRRIRAVRNTGVRVIATVYGLWVASPVTLSNGIKIVQRRDLSNHPNSLAAKAPSGFFNGHNAAAVLEIESVAAASREQHQKSHQRFLELVEQIRLVITACTLSDDAAPTVGEAWIEFLDPELELATVARSWQMSRHEGRHADLPATIDDAMAAWIEKYLQLPQDVASKCRVPMERLNLARRRLHIGDQAIDAGVGLESLLLGDSRGDLTHRLSVRTALLLGRSLKERKEVKDAVRDFYEVRSTRVHGNAAPVSDQDRERVAKGLHLLLRAIRAVIDARVMPAPATWELTGGPSENRFHE